MTLGTQEAVEAMPPGPWWHCCFLSSWRRPCYHCVPRRTLALGWEPWTRRIISALTRLNAMNLYPETPSISWLKAIDQPAWDPPAPLWIRSVRKSFGITNVFEIAMVTVNKTSLESIFRQVGSAASSKIWNSPWSGLYLNEPWVPYLKVPHPRIKNNHCHQKQACQTIIPD